MVRFRIKPEFRNLLSDKLMDFGNLGAAALVFGQLVSGEQLSTLLLFSGLALLFTCYFVSYIISL